MTLLFVLMFLFALWMFVDGLLNLLCGVVLFVVWLFNVGKER